MTPRPAEPAAIVTAYPDGPLLVRGDFEVRDVDGAVIDCRQRTVALCRCGRSAMKPFCDGTHKAGQGRERRKQNRQ
jgi:CDGSH-type Zn-finger protein